jgi:hypothetical protein
MQDEDLADDLLRGILKISRFLGEPERRGYYLAETGQIPAFKVGKIWMARKSGLRRFYAELEAKAEAEIAQAPAEPAKTGLRINRQ